MPRLPASIALTPEQQEVDLRGLARAHKTPPQTGGTSRDDPALGGGDRAAQDRPSAWRLAKDHAPLAQSLAVLPGGGRCGGAARDWGTGDVHARAGLRNHGAGLRTPGKERAAAWSARSGSRSARGAGGARGSAGSAGSGAAEAVPRDREYKDSSPAGSFGPCPKPGFASVGHKGPVAAVAPVAPGSPPAPGAGDVGVSAGHGS
jgi:hypothetical protein